MTTDTTDLQKRALLFWVGCIGTRVGLAWLAKNRLMLPYVGVAALAISIGFTTIFLGGLRTSGPETFGQPIWWNWPMRPIHAALYGLVAYHAFNGDGEMASAILGIDVAIGVAAWIHNRI
jgi:hypothetical protein